MTGKEKPVIQTIRKRLAAMGEMAVISADSFADLPRAKVNFALSYLANPKRGQPILKVIRRGLYSKIRQSSLFGEVSASASEALGHLFKEKGRNILLGEFSLYNSLGLSTQVPAVVTVLTNDSTRQVNLGGQKVSFKKIQPEINSSSKSVLIILEVIRFSKKAHEVAVNLDDWLQREVSQLSSRKLALMTQIAKVHYPLWVQGVLLVTLVAVAGKMSDPGQNQSDKRIKLESIELPSKPTSKTSAKPIKISFSQIALSRAVNLLASSLDKSPTYEVGRLGRHDIRRLLDETS